MSEEGCMTDWLQNLDDVISRIQYNTDYLPEWKSVQDELRIYPHDRISEKLYRFLRS